MTVTLVGPCCPTKFEWKKHIAVCFEPSFLIVDVYVTEIDGFDDESRMKIHDCDPNLESHAVIRNDVVTIIDNGNYCIYKDPNGSSLLAAVSAMLHHYMHGRFSYIYFDADDILSQYYIDHTVYDRFHAKFDVMTDDLPDESKMAVLMADPRWSFLPDPEKLLVHNSCRD